MAAPLLLLHGLGGTAAFWEDLAPLLGDDVRAVDLPPGEVNAKALALLAELDEPHVVVGHSLGGMVAQEMALASPGLVRSLVLANTIPGASERVIAINEASAAFVEQHGSAALPLDGLFAPKASAAARDQLRASMAATPAGRLADDLRSICRFDARDRLAQCSVPALVLGGEHEANLADQRLLAGLLGTELVVVAGTGHLSPTEAPVAWTDIVQQFLSDAGTPHNGPRGVLPRSGGEP